MKRSKFTESQIAFILRQAEEGTAITEVCRKSGISKATFYNWRHKYGGLTPSGMKRLRQLEEENGNLKKLVADLSLDKAMLQDVTGQPSFRRSKNFVARVVQGWGQVQYSVRPNSNWLKDGVPLSDFGFVCGPTSL